MSKTLPNLEDVVKAGLYLMHREYGEAVCEKLHQILFITLYVKGVAKDKDGKKLAIFEREYPKIDLSFRNWWFGANSPNVDVVLEKLEADRIIEGRDVITEQKRKFRVYKILKPEVLEEAYKEMKDNNPDLVRKLERVIKKFGGMDTEKLEDFVDEIMDWQGVIKAMSLGISVENIIYAFTGKRPWSKGEWPDSDNNLD